MKFQQLVQKDLKVCFNTDEFAKEIVHIFGNQEESLSILFDSKVEISLKADEYEGNVSTVPMITVLKSESLNITNASLFNIEGIEYEVIYKDKNNDVIKVYLGKN